MEESVRFLVFAHGNIVSGSSGPKYDKDPVKKVKVRVGCSYHQFVRTICIGAGIDPFANGVEILHRHPNYMTHGVSFQLVTIGDVEDLEGLVNMAKELGSHLIQHLYVRTCGHQSEAVEVHTPQVNPSLTIEGNSYGNHPLKNTQANLPIYQTPEFQEATAADSTTLGEGMGSEPEVEPMQNKQYELEPMAINEVMLVPQTRGQKRHGHANHHLRDYHFVLQEVLGFEKVDDIPTQEGEHQVGASSVPPTDPSTSVQRTEPFSPNHGAAARNVVTRTTEKFPSFTIEDRNYWPDDKFTNQNSHIFKSGQLGMCHGLSCTACPSYYNSKSSVFNNYKFYNSLLNGRKRLSSYLCSLLPDVINPHSRLVRRWNKIFAMSCLVAAFVDPLFFFLFSVEEKKKCIVLDSTMTTVVVVWRTMTDFIYLVHILLQFRLAYVAPEYRMAGSVEYVYHPEEIAPSYIQGYFFLDLFIALPLPQIMILSVVPQFKGSSTAKYAINASILIQYIPRLYRILHMLVGQSSHFFSRLIFESTWELSVVYLLAFVTSGHVVGSCWYFFGLQRVNQCLQNACRNFTICEFMDCGYGDGTLEKNETLVNWINFPAVVDCFSKDSQFDFGIYQKAVNLTTEHHSITTRYLYSLFWGFQQISTLGGNQMPSYFAWEVLFCMSIIGLGLLLFALLIGNMQTFTQALGQRNLQMRLRWYDIEQWMNHRRLPNKLRRMVREAEQCLWAAARVENEEMLLDSLPEDLLKIIRCHVYRFVKKFPIFALMEDPVLDAIYQKLRLKTYIKGSRIMRCGDLVEKVVFIVQGKLEIIGEDGPFHLSAGDMCGGELLFWHLDNCLANEDGKRIRLTRRQLLSCKDVQCSTNVEAFVLRAADLKEVTSIYARFLCNPRLQGAIRRVSPYWRALAATRIQHAWRERKRRLSRGDASQFHHHFICMHG